MTDKNEIKDEKIDDINGGSGYAVPDKIDVCPNCGSDDVFFDKSVYNPTKGEMTYYFICLDCRYRFTRN